jgi:hypothetical protein
MKIGIDLNDVLRSYTAQFAKYYQKEIDRSFDIDNVEVWTNDLQQIFPFTSGNAYKKFLYEELPVEIFGMANTTSKNMSLVLKNWFEKIENVDEEIELCFISTKEIDKTVGSTLFFLSKLACKIGEVHLLWDENLVFDKCDVIITANPEILQNTPEGKIAIKITTPYNEQIQNDFEYESFLSLTEDDKLFEKIKNNLTK